MNETVRNNILFGETFNEEKYKRAIYYSGLEKDLMILHKGDRTLIGQRGCTISGGQKVRIAFARALYSDADIFLLDDIFSAMDAHVSSFLFQKNPQRTSKRKDYSIDHPQYVIRQAIGPTLLYQQRQALQITNPKAIPKSIIILQLSQHQHR